jgi:DNA repair protein RecO (recombination protein O)
MGTYYTRGIILQHRHYREADRLLTIFSDEDGKITAVAKGSRKIASKLGGSLEPLTQALFMLVRGRSHTTVAHAEVIKNYRRIKSDFDKLFLAQYISHVADISTKLHQREPRLYALLTDVFGYLEICPAAARKLALVRWYFVWRHLSCLGFHPELRHCLVCGRNITATRNFFNLKKGGCVHAACQAVTAESVVITTDAIKVLRFIFDKPWRELARIAVTPILIRELDALTTAFLNYTQEQDVRLAQFSLAPKSDIL